MNVCDKCGWYEHHPTSTECDPVAGFRAARAMAAVPEVDSTKLGYGTGSFAFTFDPSFSIHLATHPHTTQFHLVHVWLNDGVDHDDLVDLVQTLAAWRKRRKEAKR